MMWDGECICRFYCRFFLPPWRRRLDSSLGHRVWCTIRLSCGYGTFGFESRRSFETGSCDCIPYYRLDFWLRDVGLNCKDRLGCKLTIFGCGGAFGSHDPKLSTVMGLSILAKFCVTTMRLLGVCDRNGNNPPMDADGANPTANADIITDNKSDSSLSHGIESTETSPSLVDDPDPGNRAESTAGDSFDSSLANETGQEPENS